MIQQGIATSLDAIMRSDIFPIVQDGIYAYDNNLGLSTISEDGLAKGLIHLIHKQSKKNFQSSRQFWIIIEN